MRYNIPYFKYNFDFTNIDENLYQYFRSNSLDKILSDHKKLKQDQLGKFKQENKREFVIYIISILTFLVSCFITFGSISEIISIQDDIVGFFGVLILFSFFGLFYTYSFALSWGEMRRALKRRKKVLKKAHKFAQKSTGFSDFIEKIEV